MGTWGYGNFDNDGAIDWLSDFVENPGESKIHSAFRFANDDGESIDSIDSEEALAAAEVIALLKGNKAEDFPEEDEQELSTFKVDDLNLFTEKAIQVVRRIKTNSELRELWEESAEVDEWLQKVSDLELRLSK